MVLRRLPPLPFTPRPMLSFRCCYQTRCQTRRRSLLQCRRYGTRALRRRPTRPRRPGRGEGKVGCPLARAIASSRVLLRSCNLSAVSCAVRRAPSCCCRALSDPEVLQRRNDAIAKVHHPTRSCCYPRLSESDTRLLLYYHYPPTTSSNPPNPPLQLEAARALKPRKRNYDNRGAVSFSSSQQAVDSGSIDAALADPRNARACRHFFLSPGGSGCSRGDNCRFTHVLES